MPDRVVEVLFITGESEVDVSTISVVVPNSVVVLVIRKVLVEAALEVGTSLGVVPGGW